MATIVGRAAQAFSPRAVTGHGAQLAGLLGVQRVDQVDRGADVVGHDVDPAAQRGQGSAGEVHDGVVLREHHDAGVGEVGQPAEAGGVRRPVGAEHLAAGVEHQPAARVADDGGAAGQRDAVRRRGAELPLLGVAEDVDTGPQLGDDVGVQAAQVAPVSGVRLAARLGVEPPLTTRGLDPDRAQDPAAVARAAASSSAAVRVAPGA